MAATLDFFKAWDWYQQRTHARMKGSELQLEQKIGEVWTLRDGKVIRYKAFDTPAEARGAAGLADKQAAD